MLGRVTQRSIATSALVNLQNTQARTAKLQEQISSGSSLSKGSDDSVRAASALRLNDQIAVNTENGRNLTEAKGWMTTQEGALDSTVDALQDIRNRVVQAGNGSLDSTGLKALANAIRAARDTIMGDANTPYQGRAVFAGTSDNSLAFNPDYTTNDDGGVVSRTISVGVNMTVNISGDAVYGPAGSTATPAASVFKELTDLAANIEAGTYTNTSAVNLNTSDSRINLATNAMATIGAKTNQLDHAEDVNTSQLQYLTAQLDDVQGTDPAKAYLEFTQQNIAYQAALQVTAKSVQTTLLDFLR